ncbi:MAG TPA: hypothetical protein VGB76_06620 [Pyrinomonadaceae bacterium]|jgi:photosystem II stability/assembly factor-like uncharacterized protein
MLKATVLALASFLLLQTGIERSGSDWNLQQSNTKVRLRGISAVSHFVAWASGERGTYARTTDAGQTWRVGTVPEASELDFRDVDAFDEKTAYLLSIGEGEKSRIYKTTDGGAHWTLQFKNTRPTAFFDAMAFWDRDHGIAMSDPVDGRFLIITTSDGGATWRETPAAGMPPALAGEGGFAASGTCLTVEGKRNVWFGTGGTSGARVFRSTDRGRTWKVANTSIASGKSAGIFSIAFRDARNGVVVGGDYTKESESKNNAATTRDGGKTWTTINAAPPNGYRSCVVYVRNGERVPMLLAVGPSGTDYSTDQGASWKRFSGADGFHTASFAPASGAVWAAGEQGRIGITYISPSPAPEKRKGARRQPNGK